MRTSNVFIGMTPMLSTLEMDAVVIGLIVCCAVIYIMWLFVRHRVLVSRRGAFLCGLRVMGGSKPGGWMIGTARYVDGTFEWYRVIDPRPGPTIVLKRGGLCMVEHHAPNTDSSLALAANAYEIVTLETGHKGKSSVCQIAVEPGVVMGLMSWLEAAPPGGVEYATVGHLV
ncbi:DUF2550 domain-containing protein [Cutibacterium sp.]|uniref:DUF2550 domain-containing protein n=1 Tax=Cutibacterium sp. TaxID=1912221 RepID=UPI0026DAFFC8|nr:DUF2550 domain-containing protein [Cutibacterium sp.]MDO4412025.1 DUF2550 domain-containing protein [Cutibacterium sp.]